jgi:hypothetical protein
MVTILLKLLTIFTIFDQKLSGCPEIVKTCELHSFVHWKFWCEVLKFLHPSHLRLTIKSIFTQKKITRHLITSQDT